MKAAITTAAPKIAMIIKYLACGLLKALSSTPRGVSSSVIVELLSSFLLLSSLPLSLSPASGVLVSEISVAGSSVVVSTVLSFLVPPAKGVVSLVIVC